MRALFVFAAAVGWGASLFAAPAPVPAGPRAGRWAHEGAKLAPDPRVTWGRLDNGFRYALLPHNGTPGCVTLQLVVLSGSLDERPDELGIAHFTEHVAFGGSTTFRPEEMVGLFQRLGIEYGSDVNAITTFDHTAFRLDFRQNDPALLREGLKLFRGFADGLTFDPAIIEQERRVVLAELRNHHTIADARQRASLPVVFRGLMFPQREPGGSEEQIAKFTRAQFLNFYQRCYRPDLMVLVGAGDFDPAAMAGLVRELFGDIARPTAPLPVRDEGRLDARALRAGVFRISGVGVASVEVASVVPPAPGPDSLEAHIEEQRRQFVMELFAERLHGQMEEGVGAEAGYQEIVGNGMAVASVGVPAPAWSRGVIGLDRMVRLTLERGFDPVDLEERRKRELRMTALMLDQLPTLDPGTLCEALVDSITDHTVFDGFERKFTTMRDWLERFTPAEAQKTFRGMWQPASLAIQVAGGVDLELEPEKILQDLQKSRRSGLANVMPATHRDTPFTLPKFGVPTAVVERRELPELGAKLMRFGNNVRLNFVASRQEPGLVRAMVRVGSGLLTMPGNKPALKEFGLNTLLASGSVHVRPEQLNALAEERFLEFGFDVADRDAFTFRGLMATEQLETFLGIVADILHEPEFNSYVHEDERERAALNRMASSGGMGEGLRELTDYLFKGDARFTWGQPLDYISMSVVDVRRWMQEPLARGYVEVTIVGDLPEDTAVHAMTRTLGSLGPRAATKTTPQPPKPVHVTARPGYERIEFIGEQNLGLVVGTWPIEAAMHVRDQAALEVLAKILEIRVRHEVREKLGLAYSPSASFESYDGFPDFALLRAQIDVTPTDAGKVAPLVQSIGAAVAEKGVEEGEFIGARGILRSQLRQAFRDNEFLVEALMRAQERPEEAQEIVGLRGDLMDKVTRDEVNAWAAKILPADNCRAAAVVPKAFVGFMDGGR
ncbi:MAG TPA: insulinase family protein [Opitutaceae bacterium]|nr:insulinase family protein [Opitutaceae bacterium]